MTDHPAPVPIANTSTIATCNEVAIEDLLDCAKEKDTTVVIIGFCGDDPTIRGLLANLLLRYLEQRGNRTWMKSVTELKEPLIGFPCRSTDNWMNRILAWPHLLPIENKDANQSSNTKVLVLCADENMANHVSILESLLCSICDVVVDCRQTPWEPQLLYSLIHVHSTSSESSNPLPSLVTNVMPYFCFVAVDIENGGRKVLPQVLETAEVELAKCGNPKFSSHGFALKSGDDGPMIQDSNYVSLHPTCGKEVAKIITGIGDRLKMIKGEQQETIKKRLLSSIDIVNQSGRRYERRRGSTVSTKQRESERHIHTLINKEVVLNGGNNLSENQMQNNNLIATIPVVAQDNVVIPSSKDGSRTAEVLHLKHIIRKNSNESVGSLESSTVTTTVRQGGYEEAVNVESTAGHQQGGSIHTITQATNLTVANRDNSKQPETSKSKKDVLLSHKVATDGCPPFASKVTEPPKARNAERGPAVSVDRLLEDITALYEARSEDLLDTICRFIYEGGNIDEDPIVGTLKAFPAYNNASRAEKETLSANFSQRDDFLRKAHHISAIGKTLSSFRQEMEKKFKMHRSFEGKKLREILTSVKDRVLGANQFCKTKNVPLLDKGLKKIGGYYIKDNDKIEEIEQNVLANFADQLGSNYSEILKDVVSNYILPNDLFKSAQDSVEEVLLDELIKICELQPSQKNVIAHIRMKASAALSSQREKWTIENNRRRTQVELLMETMTTTAITKHQRKLEDCLSQKSPTKGRLQQTHSEAFSIEMSHLNKEFENIPFRMAEKEKVEHTKKLCDRFSKECDKLLDELKRNVPPFPQTPKNKKKSRSLKACGSDPGTGYDLSKSKGTSATAQSNKEEKVHNYTPEIRKAECTKVVGDTALTLSERNTAEEMQDTAITSEVDGGSVTDRNKNERPQTYAAAVRKSDNNAEHHVQCTKPQIGGEEVQSPVVAIELSWDVVKLGYRGANGKLQYLSDSRNSLFSPYFEIMNGKLCIVPANFAKVNGKHSIMDVLEVASNLDVDQDKGLLYLIDFLSAIKQTAQDVLRCSLSDVVVTVPLSLTTMQRHTILYAAGAAGFERKVIVNDTVAAACYAVHYCSERIPRDTDFLIAVIKGDVLSFNAIRCNYSYEGGHIKIPFSMGFKSGEPLFCQNFSFKTGDISFWKSVKTAVGDWVYGTDSTTWVSYKANVRSAVNVFLKTDGTDTSHHLVVSQAQQRSITNIFTQCGNNLTSNHELAITCGALLYDLDRMVGVIDQSSVYKVAISANHDPSKELWLCRSNLRFGCFKYYEIPPQLLPSHAFLLTEKGQNDEISYPIGFLKLNSPHGGNQTPSLYCGYNTDGIFEVLHVNCGEMEVEFDFEYAKLG